MELAGRTALVTGASGGLGRHIALGLAAEGADVALTYHRSREAAEALAKDIEELDRKAVLVELDVTDEDSVARGVGQAVEGLGGLDILINGAGINIDGVTSRLDRSSWDSTLAANLTGAFLCTKHALPVMTAAGFGRVVSISSIVGRIGVPGTAAYAATKSGLFGMTRATAAEVAHKGVTVNAIALGYFDGGILHALPQEVLDRVVKTIPVRRFGSMEELQWAVLTLVSPRAGYTTGSVVDVNGGLW